VRIGPGKGARAGAGAIDLAAEVADIREELAELQTASSGSSGRPVICRKATTCITGSRPTRVCASTADMGAGVGPDGWL